MQSLISNCKVLSLLIVCIWSGLALGQPWAGSGDANNPYQIWDANDMQAIGANSVYWDAHFKLMTDINLADYTGEQFNIIGNGTAFTGIFDGNDHTISNFTYESNEVDRVGLFGYVADANAEIKNLRLLDTHVDVGEGACVGGLVGSLNRGTIAGCHIEGGSVAGMYYVGGLVGRSERGIISACYSSISVDGDGWYAGGLAGYHESGTISNCVSSGSVSGYYRVGGLVGENLGGIISGSYATGSVSGDDNMIGGLVGWNNGIISDCYARGDVSGEWFIGGLVGENGGIIIRCYSVGSVSGNIDVGGLVGLGFPSQIEDSFWDVNSSGLGTSAGGMAKTTAEMQDPATYIFWGCDSNFVWTIDAGNDYPRLLQENKPGEVINWGCGTESDPYLVFEPSQMQAIGASLEHWDRYFKLMADIDLGGYTAETFDIIGYNKAWNNIQPFTGVFDGNGHTISNFTYESNNTNYIGLFGWVDDPNAEIRDLGLIEPNVNAGTGEGVGSLVGGIIEATIVGCYVEGGSVSGEWFVGGLVGENLGSIISGSYATGSVSGYEVVGGLVGWNVGTISDCYSAGSVYGNDAIGGLVGGNGRRILHCYAVSEVSGNTNIGGLVGYDASGDYTSCFWDNNVNPDVNGIGNTTDANVIGEYTANMQTESTFTDAGWDFVGEVINGPNDVWTICEGEDYPRLAWEKYGGGNGTEANPYLIRTSCQMNAIGADSNDWDAHFKLMADIDLGGYTGTSFNIIGDYGNHFTGVFDGNGHTISGFTYYSNGVDCIGLFGYVDEPNAQVRNLGLADPNINAGSGICVGALVGVLADGNVFMCGVDAGNIRGGDYVGGLVGGNGSADGTTEGTISDCYAAVMVSGKNKVGGLLGFSQGTVAACYAAGVVDGNEEVGGLVGKNRGTIFESYSSADVSGGFRVGGLVGNNGYIGGAGHSFGWVSNSYALGSVVGTDQVGGLAGINAGGIYYCYSAGGVSGNTDVGGLVGVTQGDGGVIDSFWDWQSSGQGSSSGGTPKTTAEMQTESTFTDAGWDFVGEVINGPNDIWIICNEGYNYPRLWWEQPRVYHVDIIDGNDNNDGLTAATAFATIQAGIDVACSEEMLQVWPGVYNESLFFINKGITVRSATGAAVIEASGVYAVSFYTSEGPNSVLKNFVIRNSDTGIFVSSGSPTLEHLTIVDCNLGIEAQAGAGPNIRNCILWNNSLGDLFQCQATYSCIESGDEGPGNISEDPLFADPSGDYHLKSEGWRWTEQLVHDSHWCYDSTTSRCIDAGNPGSSLAEELLSVPDDPNNEWGENLRVNMGAYGGTTQASMPPYGWALLADLNNDGVVNFVDFTKQASDWQANGSEWPGDLNRDGMVNVIDCKALVDEWLQATDWFEW